MSDQKTRYKVAYMDPNFHHQGGLKMIAATNYDFRVNFIFVITGFGKQFYKKLCQLHVDKMQISFENLIE